MAEVLVRDRHDLVKRAVGGWIREAGKQDPRRLLRFLDSHAGVMPRATLRLVVEKLAPAVRARLLAKQANEAAPN